MTKKSITRTDVHASDHRGRKVAPQDKLLFSLVEFANLLTPRIEGRSALAIMSDIRRAATASGDTPPVEPIPVADYLPRMAPALTILWVTARDAFPHPSRPGIVAVPIPGDPPIAICADAAEVAAKAWTVRSVLWRLVLAREHQDRRAFVTAAPPVRNSISIDEAGRLRVEYHDLTPALLATLDGLDISRLRICKTRYQRTRSRCCRLVLALRHDQKECSCACADQRRHNLTRHPQRQQLGPLAERMWKTTPTK